MSTDGASRRTGLGDSSGSKRCRRLRLGCGRSPCRYIRISWPIFAAPCVADARSRELPLFIGSGVAFLLSALSKESGLLFPLIGMPFFLLRKNWANLWKTAAVAAFVAASYFSLRAAAEHNPAPTLTPPPPLLVRPIIVARAVAEYAGLILFPMNLHMDRDVETQPSGFNEASMAHAAWRELQTLVGLVLIAVFFIGCCEHANAIQRCSPLSSSD